MRDIATDLTWIDMLKGMAIIGVFFDNWDGYYGYTLPGWGPFVQVFFILSGFGLTLSYLNGKTSWNWGRWAWRRITKVVVPYQIAVIFSFVLGVMASSMYLSVDEQFEWSAFLAYVTFTRNFFPTTWDWNPPLWFMPVIVGLYLSFPLLIQLLERWGAQVLLLVSLVITYSTILSAIWLGASRTHSADLFSFWLIQFSLGMGLAWVRAASPEKLRNLLGVKAFLAGVGLFAFSWGMRYLPLGRSLNDSFTSVGIFLILLNLVWVGRLLMPAIGEILSALGSQSYLMFLIHYPIMAFLIGPLLKVLTDPVILTVLGAVYIGVIFIGCYFISQPLSRFTSWLYSLFFPAYGSI